MVSCCSSAICVLCDIVLSCSVLTTASFWCLGSVNQNVSICLCVSVFDTSVFGECCCVARLERPRKVR